MVERPVSGMLTCMESRKSVALMGLLALLVLDIVLVAWALWPSAASTNVSSPTPIATATPEPTDAHEPPAPTEVPAGPPVPLTRLIAAVTPDIAWVADAGSCGRPGSVHVTRSRGEEWTAHETPGSVTRLRTTDGSSGFVVGGDADCAARVWYTGDAGETWSAPQSAAEAWGRDPDSARQIIRPGGEPVEPCEAGDVFDLVGLSGGTAFALCEDGTFRTTTDRGATWSTSDSRDGLLAISLEAPGEGAAVGLEDECTGVAVTPITGGRLSESACVDEASYAPGHVAISVTDGVVWLVAGGDVLRADTVDAPFTVVSSWPGT